MAYKQQLTFTCSSDTAQEAHFLKLWSDVRSLEFASPRKEETLHLLKSQLQALQNVPGVDMVLYQRYYEMAEAHVFMLEHQSPKIILEKLEFALPVAIKHDTLQQRYCLPSQAQHELNQIFLSPLQFPNLVPKEESAAHFVLLYGLDGCGKTALVNHLHDIMIQQNNPVLHLRDSITRWKPDSLAKQWNQFVLYIRYLMQEQPKTLFLIEIEHIDLLKNISLMDLSGVPQSHLLYFVGTTDKPMEAEAIFPPHNRPQTRFVFVDNPDEFQIQKLLEAAFSMQIHPYSEIACNKSPFLNTANQLYGELRNISRLLTLREPTPHQPQLGKIGRTRINPSAKLKYGITMSTLVQYLIPRFIYALQQLRKNWIDTDCLHVGVSDIGACSNSKTFSQNEKKEMLEKKQPLTRQEVAYINNRSCETVPNKKCLSGSENITINWDWVEKAQEKIKEAMQLILLDVSDDPTIQKTYEDCFAFWISH